MDDSSEEQSRTLTASQSAIRAALRSRDYAAVVDRLDALKGSYAALYLLEALPSSPANVTVLIALREAIGGGDRRKR